MAGRKSILVVGIGGITCSFKSTLAKNILKLISNEYENSRIEILHQDQYYLNSDQVPPIPELNHFDYECPESLRLDDMTRDLENVIHRYTQRSIVEKEKKTIILVEGIMLYCHEHLRRLFDQRYFMFGTYDECKKIRSNRIDYIPPDVDGYFDGYVWPYAVKYENEARHLAKDMQFEFLPMAAYDRNLSKIMLGIRKWLDRDWLSLTDEELDLREIVRFVTEPTDGAVSIFCGVTRETFEGKRVLHLEYEAYNVMAYSEMRKLCDLLRQKYTDIDRVALHHRLGVVPVTESSVIIAVSAPHRKSAQAATAFAIDHLKSHVPIWKKEIYSDGLGAWKANSECCTQPKNDHQ